ncbi:MAG TPA: lysophospholipid acyltransferase family protein [Flavipsychrobacter sp.]|nr:lysophospholipid acyltransferase family protein [Flavipsychrobacter sp.]
MRKFWQPFYTVYVVITFLVSIVLAFPFFLTSGLINNAASRKFIYNLVHYWSKGWLFITGMPLRVSGSFPKNGKYIIIANHISYLDTVNIYGALPEYFRTLARKEMVHIPVFGMIYRQLTILVDRSSSDSRTKSMRLMYRQLKNECHIAIFPEGSFNETGETLKSFYDGAFRLAVTTQTPLLPMIFPDTEQRWHYSAWWKFSPGRNRSVFLEPITITGKNIDMLKQEAFTAMETALKDNKLAQDEKEKNKLNLFIH